MTTHDFKVEVARSRSALQVTARRKGPKGAAAREATMRVAGTDARQAGLVVHAVFSGEADGVWFRIEQEGTSRVFSRHEVIAHPALCAVLRLIADEVESAKPCEERLLSLLFQSLLVYVGRIHPARPHSLRLVRNARVERALELLNSDLSKRWTVELLAKAVGLSRPAFAKQFLRVMHQSPMQYLTCKRMQAAAALLFDTEASLAEVATEVGYDSEFAFNRAFKRHHGVPPGQYRRKPPRTCCLRAA